MTWYPIAFLPPQIENSSGVPYSGAVLKAYRAGTSTPIPMATDYTGATTAASLPLNASGYPTYLGTIVIPHLQENYKLALYPNQAAADANSGAIWNPDNIQIAPATNSSFIQYFDGDDVTATFTLSQDFGTDENALMVFSDRKLPDYVTNGDFAADTNWTKGAGWTIGAGVATATGAISTAISQSANQPVIAGMSYTVIYTITRSAGGLIPSIGGTAGTERTASGTYKETIIAGSTQALAFTGNAFTGTLDVVSVKPTYAAQRVINRPDEITVVGNQLTLANIPPTGTKNIIVFSPSSLLGAANNAAAAAATSETNAAASAATATAQTAIAVAAADEAQASSQLIGFRWDFDSSTVMGDPGTGEFRLNNATLASVTAIALNDTSADSGAPDVSPYILTWDDAVNAVRGTLLLRNADDPTDFVVYDITGASTDNSGWTQLAVTYRAGSGTLVAGDTCLFQFNRAGDAGDMVKAVYDPANIAQQLVGLTASQALTNKSVNGVTLTAAGSATNFLNAAGAYSAPAAGITLGTAQATTSGTFKDFTGIPAGTKRITINFAGVSLNGTDNLLVQIGDSGGIENSGYVGAYTRISNGDAVLGGFLSDGFLFYSNDATALFSGSVTLSLQDLSDNQWCCSGTLGRSTLQGIVSCGGYKPLSATLDRVRITTPGGANTFDAGKINISYE